MNVEDIMTKEIVSIDKDEELKRAMDLMKKHGITKIPVTNDGGLVGAITDADITNTLGSVKSKGLPASRLHVSSVMNKTLLSVPPGTPISEVIEMAKKGETALIHVVSNDKLVGVITNYDLLSFVNADTPVEDFMIRNVHALESEDRVVHARRMMIDHNIERLPVLEQGKILGLVTETDVAFALAKVRKDVTASKQEAHLRELRVNEIMETKVVTCGTDMSAKDAAKLMIEKQIGCLPMVNEEGVIRGIITRTDLIKTIE